MTGRERLAAGACGAGRLWEMRVLSRQYEADVRDQLHTALR